MKKLILLLLLFGVANASTITIALTYNQMLNLANAFTSNLITPNMITANGINLTLIAPPNNVPVLANNIGTVNLIYGQAYSISGNTVGTLIAPANNFPPHKIITVTNGGGTIEVNNVTINSPQPVNVFRLFPSSNTTQSFSITPITNVTFGAKAVGYTLINNAINLTPGGSWSNQTYNVIVRASLQKYNIVENVSCGTTTNVILNIPNANVLVGVKSCPKWNYNPVVTPSYNTPTVITNSSLNFSATINVIPTSWMFANLSANQIGTLNSLNVSNANVPVGYIDKLRKIVIGYPNYHTNLTLVPGRNYQNPLVGVGVYSLNWSSLAFNWNVLIQQYEKNVIPLCARNATWTEGNITYCARLKVAPPNVTDIRTLCQLQQLIDHNVTEVLPDCVLNAVKLANVNYNNTYHQVLKLQGDNSNLTQRVRNDENGGLLIDGFGFLVAMVVVIALALSAYTKVTGWRPFRPRQ